MTSFPTRVAQASFKSDFSKMRKASAIRRGLVVFVVTLGAYYFFGTAIASHVAITAMFVGQLDRGGSPRQEWHWMAGATILMAGISFLAAVPTGHVNILLLILALLAFWAGAGIGINIRLPAVLLYTSAVLAAALIQPVAPDQAVATTLAVLVAGGLQTVLTALTSPVVGDLPERRAVAAALSRMGTEFVAVSQDKEPTKDGFSAVAAGLTKAEVFLRESDISGDTRRQFADILSTADLLAQEGRSYISRVQVHVGRPRDPATMKHFALVGLALQEAAHALVVFHPESHLKRLDSIINELRIISHDTNSKTAANIAEAIGHLASSMRSAMDDPKIHRGHRERSLSLWERIKASVAPGSVPLKHGLRLAIAVLIGMVAAHLLGLDHGSWVAVTMIMLLRPDAGPALTRFVSRSIGNVLGACVVVGVAIIAGGNNPVLIVAIGISSTILFTVMPVNYTWAAMCSSMTAIFALTIGGELTTDLAFERLIDVLLGCLLGVALAFIFPIWLRTNLPDQCAEYLKRVSKWVKTCSKMATLEPNERGSLVEKAHNQSARVRSARQSLSATFDASLVEPPAKNIDIYAIGRIMRHMRQCNNSIMAAEQLLAHGTASSKKAGKLGRKTFREVQLTATVVSNPERRDTLSKTFDDLELDMSETGTLNVVSAPDVAADKRRKKAERKKNKKDKPSQMHQKKPKAKRGGKNADLEVVMAHALKSAHHAYRAAEASRANYDTFL